MAIIQLPEVLRRMESGEEFSLVYYTCDKNRNTAGKKVEIEKGFLTRSKVKNENLPSKTDVGDKTRADHYKNQTRNIGIRGTTNIRKAKIFLITEFNGIRVIW